MPPPRFLKLAGARIIGALELEAAALLFPLVLQDCWFDQAVNVSAAQAPALRLIGCHLPTLMAEQLVTRGDVQFSRAFATHGAVNLRSARIGGQLNLVGAHLTSSFEPALMADGLTVERDMLCTEGFTAEGQVSLLGAHIGGLQRFAVVGDCCGLCSAA
jgi:hypothetical protein